MNKVIIASAIIAACSISSVALAKHSSSAMRHHKPVEQIVKHLRGLSLTEAQRSEMKVLFTNFRASHSNASESNFEAPSFDMANASEAELTQFIEEKIEASASKRFAFAQLRHDIYALLTPSQQQLLEEKDAEREARHEERLLVRQDRMDKRTARSGPSERSGRNSEHGGRNGERGGRKGMFKGLDLTREQKVSLKALREEAAVSSETHKVVMRDFREAQQALVRSDAFSEDAFKALFAQYKDNLIAAGVAKAKHKQAMFAVLTESQQQTLKARHAEERELREMLSL